MSKNKQRVVGLNPRTFSRLRKRAKAGATWGDFTTFDQDRIIQVRLLTRMVDENTLKAARAARGR